MIIVLDTNVMISALLSAEGPPAQIMHLWEAGALDIAMSAPLLDEVKRVLGYDKVKKHLGLTPEETDRLLRGWRTTAIFVESVEKLDVIKEDPDDNRVLECAVAAEADYIVSGDHHLTDLGEYRGIEVLPPAGFIVLMTM